MERTIQPNPVPQGRICHSSFFSSQVNLYQLDLIFLQMGIAQLNTNWLMGYWAGLAEMAATESIYSPGPNPVSQSTQNWVSNFVSIDPDRMLQRITPRRSPDCSSTLQDRVVVIFCYWQNKEDKLHHVQLLMYLLFLSPAHHLFLFKMPSFSLCLPTTQPLLPTHSCSALVV